MLKINVLYYYKNLFYFLVTNKNQQSALFL